MKKVAQQHDLTPLDKTGLSKEVIEILSKNTRINRKGDFSYFTEAEIRLALNDLPEVIVEVIKQIYENKIPLKRISKDEKESFLDSPPGKFFKEGIGYKTLRNNDILTMHQILEMGLVQIGRIKGMGTGRRKSLKTLFAQYNITLTLDSSPSQK